MNKREIISSKNSLEEEIKAKGIYFLIKDNEIVYVGKSTNVFSRVTAHTYGKDFDSFNYELYPDYSKNELLEIESEYIAKFTPKYNKTISCKYKILADISKLGVEVENQRNNIEVVIINNKIHVTEKSLKQDLTVK